MEEENVREIRDSKALAAIAHPLRRRLLDLLHLDGPATASALAARTDQAVGNISHHLKVLAASELVEEAAELARDRRERWWRRTSSAIKWGAQDFPGDPIAETAEALTLNYQHTMAREWLAKRDTYPPEWRGALFSIDGWARLSIAELDELNDRIVAMLAEYRDRALPDDGVERRPVFFAARASLGQP
ncbi:helix-turn-helix domain-containing protein [Amycolatopsis sp. NPDC051102]|uniref:helix-turn-helix domain-containing protein n=1 Tax=Amycolatopsis sp. NPDC051102 TaxID=3155163 RepID=UPI00344AD5A7